MGAAGQPPDERQAARERERAMLTGVSLDVAINLTKLVTALWANSLTLLGDWLRGGLLTLLQIFLLVLMRKIHRGQLAGYDYGTRKLEQFLNVVVGGAMLLAALWLGVTTFLHSGAHPPQSTAGLALALGAATTNLVINTYVLSRLWRAAKGGVSIIINGQVVARLMQTLVSFGVAAAVGTNLAYQGTPVGDWADILGSIFVVATMIGFGVKIIGEAVPHLLDRALAEANQGVINRVLAEHFDDYEELQAVRTRTEGQNAWVEIEVGFAPARSIAEIQVIADRLAAQVRLRIPQAQVIVIPRVATPFRA
ncbi:cation diffusion facilitator family transporter [Roseococcus sp. YIM B11640]|uniref:cation diffusion facilitator family transporter n=1 Tax=Roseococcus sp. YIM B11640 TaxID=3133973 RepID=UPI003C7C80CA